MRISISGLLVDPVPSSPNLPHMNCMEDSKENYERYLGVRGLKYFSVNHTTLIMLVQRI